jgi:serine/threonine-protein kinase
VVAPIDRISTRDELALVFPFVDGQSLSQRLAVAAESGTQVESREAASMAADIADALAAAHAAGVIHRDVKPGNVLLGTDGRALLADFGISRALDEEAVARDVTGAGLTVGTLPYMAPEQLAATGSGPATDVFALGVVLYQMLSGRRPYEAASPVALAHEQQIPPARIAGAPPALVDMALRAMATDPASRPSANEMARSLRVWLSGSADGVALDAPTVVVSASPKAASAAWFDRRAATAAAAALGALVVAVVALAAIAPTQPPATAPGTPPAVAAIASSVATSTPRPANTASPAPPAAPAVVQPRTTPQPTPAPVIKPQPKPHGGGHGRHHHADHHHHKKKHHKHH